MSHRGKDLPTTPSQTRLLYHTWGGGAEHINQPGKGCTDTTACREGQQTAEQWQYSSTLPSQDAALVLRITNFDFCFRRSPSLSIPIPHWARGLDGFVPFSQRRGSMSAAIQHEQLANKSSLWQSQEMCAQQKGAEGRAGIPPPSAHGTQQHKEQRGGLVGREGGRLLLWNSEYFLYCSAPLWKIKFKDYYCSLAFLQNKIHSHQNWLKQDLALGQRHCSAGGSIRTPQRADPDGSKQSSLAANCTASSVS